MVIIEKNPSLKNNETNEACDSEDSPKCTIVYGQRVLQVFYGKADGSYQLDISNDKLVLQADEGGVFGDPLNGLTLTKTGAVQLDVYGGSAWRWGFTDTLQFRNGDFYVIGQTSMSAWTGDGRYDKRDVNLLTGTVIEEHQKSVESKVQIKRSKVAIKPLVHLRDYTGQSER